MKCFKSLTPVYRLKVFAVVVLAFIAIIQVSIIPAAVETGAPVEEFTTHLNGRIPKLMKRYDIPGVTIALVKGGKTVWTEAYGYADIATGRKMTVDTPCRGESISKSITAWGVMKLVERGKVDLDTPVVEYIDNWKFPESKFSEEEITVRNLLTHSSGLPLGTIGVIYDPEEEIPSLRDKLSEQAVLDREPGRSFTYSNTGFNVLELLIENVTGQGFSEYIEGEIFLPLGMEKSSFTWSEGFDPPVPFGYDLRGNPIPVYVYPDKASGGLFSTAEDIATFISAGMTDFSDSPDGVLSSENIEKIYSPSIKPTGFLGIGFDHYGLGHLIEYLNDKKAVAHGGQGTGWMTHFHAVPETGDGIVVLTNSQRSWPFFANVLTDWGDWNGFSSLGISTLLLAQKILWGVIGLLFLVLSWQVWRIGWGLYNGRRGFSPLAVISSFSGLVQLGVSFALFGILVWAINQDYLALTSVFPMTSNWLGYSLLSAGIVLFLTALSRKRK